MNQEFGQETIYLSKGEKNINVVCQYIGCKFRIDYAYRQQGDNMSL